MLDSHEAAFHSCTPTHRINSFLHSSVATGEHLEHQKRRPLPQFRSPFLKFKSRRSLNMTVEYELVNSSVNNFPELFKAQETLAPKNATAAKCKTVQNKSKHI